MSDVKIKQPSKETTVFEIKIERLRQLALWSRFLWYLDMVAVVLVVAGDVLKSPIIQVKPTDLGGVVIGGIALYVGSLVCDFLADLGLIVLSMKKESQYVTKVVQQVQEGRR